MEEAFELIITKRDLRLAFEVMAQACHRPRTKSIPELRRRRLDGLA
jgi:hypothetical protein